MFSSKFDPGPTHAMPPESPTQRTAAAGALSVATLITKILTNAVLVPFGLRYLGREEFGLWVILQTVTSYLLLSDVGLGQTIVNFTNKAYATGDFEQINQILATAFGVYCLVVASIGTLSMLALDRLPVATWLLNASSRDHLAHVTAMLLLAAGLAFLRIPLVSFTAALVGIRQTAERQAIDLACSLFVLAGTVITLLAGGGVRALLLVTNLGLGSLMLFSYRLLRRHHRQIRLRPQSWHPGLIPALLATSIPFFFMAASVVFQRMIGNLLTARFASLLLVPEIYALLTLLRIVGWTLIDIPSRMLQPYAILLEVQGQGERLRWLAALTNTLTFTVAASYGLGVLFLARVGIRLWLGPNMYLGLGVLGPLLAAFLVDALFLSSQNFMMALNRHRGLSLVSILYAGLSLGGGILGAIWSAQPLVGMAFGFLAAALLAALPLPGLVRAWLAVSWRAYAAQYLAKPLLLLGAGLVAGGLLAAWVGTASWWSAAVCALAAVTATLSFFWRLGLAPPERKWLQFKLRTLAAPWLPAAAPAELS